MGFGDEKVIIKLRDGADHNALVHTQEDGAEVTYYPRTVPVSWRVERLQVRQAVVHRRAESPEPPRVVTFVTGVARIEADGGVSVIGEPANHTKLVDVYFRPEDSLDLLVGRQDEGFEALFSEPVGHAVLGFNRADWEIRSDDSWWIECHLHSQALRPLIDAISAGVLKEMVFRTRLKNLYGDEHPYMPFARAENLYLRPCKKDNSINMPEHAVGWLESLAMGLASADLASPQSPEFQAEADVAETFSTTHNLESVSAANQLIAMRIEHMRGTVKWVGLLIVSALALLLLK